MHTIILRTACGCEQVRDIPNGELPPVYSVSIQRSPTSYIWSTEDRIPLPLFHKRTFKYMGRQRKHGYALYMEVVE